MIKVKKHLFLAALAAIVPAFVFVPTAFAVAEESEVIEEVSEAVEEVSEVIEEVSEEAVESSEEGIVAKVVEEVHATADYFKTNWLPVLIGIGSAALSGLAFLVPALKKSSKVKQLEGLYAQAVDENSEFKKIIDGLDGAGIKEDVSAFLKGDFIAMLEEAVKRLKVDSVQYDGLRITVETLSAKVDAIVRAANIAWNSKPEAVAALTAAPEKFVVDDLQRRNDALKEYVVGKFGDEAAAEIKKIEARG